MSDTKHIVCPHCQSVNRIPSEKLGAAAKCGKCHKILLTGQPIELNQVSFTKHILKNELPVLVDFWAPWCGPCKMMAPVFEQAATDMKTQLVLAKVNTETEQGLAAQYNIRSIPTIAIFKHGKEVARTAGAMDINSLKRWAQSHI